ncbi:MAG: holo-[acyl-carrier-protein] synthase [Actinomycetota bacterium]
MATVTVTSPSPSTSTSTSGSFVIGIGVDVVDVVRFRQTLLRTPSMRSRVFTDDELVPLAERNDPVPSLAARFAAREAVMKAMGVGLGAFDFHDVWVASLPTGQPVLQVSGRADALARERGIASWHLSLTHTDDMAIAYVVASS